MAITRFNQFGKVEAIVLCKEAIGKKSGLKFGKGYVEIGGSLYKLEVTDCKKDGGYCWVRITKTDKASFTQGGGSKFGGGKEAKL